MEGQGGGYFTDSWIVEINCFNSNGNISVVFQNPSVYCSVIKCAQNISPQVSIACGPYGNLNESFDSSCPYFTRILIYKNLKVLPCK